MQTYTYKANDDGQSFTVMTYEGDDRHVIVPDLYCAKPVTILYDRLFAGHTEITTVHLPDSITDLGEFVFRWMHRPQAY